MKKKIVVAISGGIDSAVVALLLKKQGFDVLGVFMRLGQRDEESERLARAACQRLNIKFYPFNISNKFQSEVIDYFLNSYARGLTPNPCVKCNQIIKFKELPRLVREFGVEYLATGHYARKLKARNKKSKIIYKLFRGVDKRKDQSYFLYNLTQNQLDKIIFPLGGYAKEEVCRIAKKNKLPCGNKESQDVCFLAKEGRIIDHNEFLKKHVKLIPGPIKLLLPDLAKKNIQRKSKTIGRHQGLPLYTMGQRKGIEIGGIGPFYAVRMDYKTNILYVVSDTNDPALFSDSLIVRHVNWIAGEEPKLPLKCWAVIRYQHKGEECEISRLNNDYSVKFKKPQRAITPGQSAVFYGHGTSNNISDEVLGGGIIHQPFSRAEF